MLDNICPTCDPRDIMLSLFFYSFKGSFANHLKGSFLQELRQLQSGVATWRVQYKLEKEQPERCVTDIFSIHGRYLGSHLGCKSSIWKCSFLEIMNFRTRYAEEQPEERFAVPALLWAFLRLDMPHGTCTVYCPLSPLPPLWHKRISLLFLLDCLSVAQSWCTVTPL